MEALLAVVSVTVLFLLVNKYDAAVRKIRWWNRNRLLRKNAVTTIYQAIQAYVVSCPGQIVFPGFGLIEIEHSRIASPGEFWNFIDQNILTNPRKYQLFLEQLLKLYAERLHIAYASEEELKKEHKEVIKKPEKFSFSREKIINAIEEAAEIEDRKFLAERDFWRLHDTLEVLGLETWGHKSYKMYVLLEKLPLLEALKFC